MNILCWQLRRNSIDFVLFGYIVCHPQKFQQKHLLIQWRDFFFFFLCRSLKNKWTRKIAIACTFIHLFRDYTEHWLLPIWIIMMITSRYYLFLIFNVSSDLFEMITQRIWNRRICWKHITKEFFLTLFQEKTEKGCQNINMKFCLSISMNFCVRVRIDFLLKLDFELITACVLQLFLIASLLS